MKNKIICLFLSFVFVLSLTTTCFGASNVTPDFTKGQLYFTYERSGQTVDALIQIWDADNSEYYSEIIVSKSVSEPDKKLSICVDADGNMGKTVNFIVYTNENGTWQRNTKGNMSYYSGNDCYYYSIDYGSNYYGIKSFAEFTASCDPTISEGVLTYGDYINADSGTTDFFPLWKVVKIATTNHLPKVSNQMSTSMGSLVLFGIGFLALLIGWQIVPRVLRIFFPI